MTPQRLMLQRGWYVTDIYAVLTHSYGKVDAVPGRVDSLEIAADNLEVVLDSVVRRSFSHQERTRARRMAALRKVGMFNGWLRCNLLLTAQISSVHPVSCDPGNEKTTNLSGYCRPMISLCTPFDEISSEPLGAFKEQQPQRDLETNRVRENALVEVRGVKKARKTCLLSNFV